MLNPITLGQVAEATGGALSGDADLTFTSVTTDSRAVEPGSLFVALVGEKFDGHAYVAQALAKGAVAAVVSTVMEGIPHVTVSDTTVALGQIARKSRDGFSGPVIGITGSVGKTTAKELLALALSPTFSVHKTPENNNNEIGLPQTILAAPPETTALVLEMGMRGLGQIADLANIAAPTVGVVTGVGVTHIELLGTRENIATAKGELLDALTAEGLAVFPATDDFAETLRAKVSGKTLTVALDGPADLSATNLRAEGAGWRADVSTPWGTLDLFVPSPGRFNVQNALLALAVSGAQGVSLADSGNAIAGYAPTKMRLEVLQTPNGATVLSDCYNAAPDSMAGALETLMQTQPGTGGSRIAVLGEMRELGAYSDEGHALVGRAVGRLKPEMLVLVGAEPTRKISAAALAEGFPLDHVHYFENTLQAAEAMKFLVQKGDLVLVKGSRGVQMEGIVEALVS